MHRQGGGLEGKACEAGSRLQGALRAQGVWQLFSSWCSKEVANKRQPNELLRCVCAAWLWQMLLLLLRRRLLRLLLPPPSLPMTSPFTHLLAHCLQACW